MARAKINSPVDGATYAERARQAKTARADGGPLTGIWRGGNWTGFGGALECIRIMNMGSMSPFEWDNITESPRAAKACVDETGSPPDWFALGRMNRAGYVVPKVVDVSKRKP